MEKSEVLYSVLDPRGQPSGIFGRGLKPQSHPGAIQDPFAQPGGPVEPLRMAPRLGSLDNRTVYLVDTGFAGSHEFLEEVQGWFSRNMPSVKIILRRKQGSMFTDDPELWTEIKEKGNAVVFGVGG